jgi:hypothetical protein
MVAARSPEARRRLAEATGEFPTGRFRPRISDVSPENADRSEVEVG